MANKKNTTEENGGEKKVEKKSKFKKFLISGILVLLIGGTAYFVVGKGVLESAIKNYQERSLQVEVVNFNSFVINLNDSGYRRYLKTDLVIEYRDKKLGEEIAEKNYIIRDSIITFLSSKTAEEISSFEGKEVLKEEMTVKINKDLTQGEIEDLYWTEFVIQ